MRWTDVAGMAMLTTAYAISTPVPECAVQCMIEAAIPLQAPQGACHNSTQIDIFELCVNLKCTVKEALTTKNASDAICGLPLRDRTRSVSVTGIAGLSCAATTFLLRMIARIRSHQLGMDDWIMILAMGLVVPLSALSVALADHGLGKDTWSIPFDDITYILKIYYIDEPLYIGSLTVIKTSILCFYLRIFPRRMVKKAVYTVIAGNILYGTIFVLLSLFQCVPVQAAWTKWEGTVQANCMDANALGWANAAINIFFDLIILFLPLPELSKLVMSWERKIHVLLMFGLGSFVTIVSVLRLTSLVKFANTQNITWDYVPIGYWSTVEVHVSVICACLPALPSLFRAHPVHTATPVTEASVGSKLGNRDQDRVASINHLDTPPGQIRVSSWISVTSTPPSPNYTNGFYFNQGPSTISKVVGGIDRDKRRGGP